MTYALYNIDTDKLFKGLITFNSFANRVAYYDRHKSFLSSMNEKAGTALKQNDYQSLEHFKTLND